MVKKLNLAPVFVALALVMLSYACGAPSKDAGAVTQIFDAAALTLQDKATTLCNSLRTRTERPSFENLGILDQGCADAGAFAVNFNTAKAFAVKVLEKPAGTPKTVDAMVADLRTQVWLGRKFLNLALTLLNVMKDGSLTSKEGMDGLWSDKNGEGSAMSGLVKPEIKVLGEPVLEMDKLRFTAKINFQIHGIVTINNDIELAGALMDNAICLTIETPGEAKDKDSFLKSISAVVLIIPYADDVYMEMFLHTKLFDLGVEQTASRVLAEAMSTALKTIIGKVLSVKEG